jgi:formylglycine-generating enzyme
MAPTTRGTHRMSGFVRSRIMWASLAITSVLGTPSPHPDSERTPVDTLGIRWIEVEAGSLAPGGDSRRPPVLVAGFLLGATEVTFDQYDAFCDATGKPKPDDNGWGRGSRPVLNVSYDDAMEFCKWVGKITGTAVRLPNEAEWEYAAHGGHHSRGYIYSGSNDKDEVSWNEDNSEGRTHPVGTKIPNELGLFDMSGNLWEWCADGPATKASEARVPKGGKERALRGNSFDNPGTTKGVRLSLRLDGDSRHINIGFRIARSK